MLTFVVPLFAAYLLASPARSDPEGADAPPKRDEFEKGAELFGATCSACHGRRMVNPANAVFDLRKFPRGDRDRFFTSVQNGKKSMPPWKDVLHPDEIEALWAYVRAGGMLPE